MSIDFVLAALESTGVPAALLNAPQRESVARHLLTRLGVGIRKHEPWADVSAPSGQQLYDGWKFVAGYVESRSCYFFLDGASMIWELESGADLLRVLEECPAFEFYVSDEQCRFFALLQSS